MAKKTNASIRVCNGDTLGQTPDDFAEAAEVVRVVTVDEVWIIPDNISHDALDVHSVLTVVEESYLPRRVGTDRGCAPVAGATTRGGAPVAVMAGHCEEPVVTETTKALTKAGRNRKRDKLLRR